MIRKDRLKKLEEHCIAKKILLINYKGGHCEMCGMEYNGTNITEFSFHHIYPNRKNFCIGSKRSGSLKKLYLEINKCAMLCKKCHRLVHSRLYRHIYPKILTVPQH